VPERREKIENRKRENGKRENDVRCKTYDVKITLPAGA
jgi:hypothetical protein